MGQPAFTDTTRSHRNRVLKRGSILTGITNPAIACAIRNMHDEGAELTAEVDARIPGEFLLYVPIDAIAYRCTVRWRKGGRMGVLFDGTEPKPAWHYG